MAYRSKRGRKLKKSSKRGKRVNKMRMGLRQPVQYFKRTVYLPAFIVSSTTVNVPFVNSFALADVPNATEFTTLYDQYKIMGVQFKLYPRFNSVDQNLSGGRIWTVLDYDDSNLPATINELCQYQNVKCTNTSQIHSRYLKPKFNLTTGSANIPQSTHWIDVATTSVPYRGIKGILEPTSASVAYDCKLTYYLAMKNVR